MVLIPGAGGRGWVWHLVEADLRRRGYDAFAVDLPAGETPGTWWDNVGWEQARTAAARRNGYSPDFDLDSYFLHDIPADLRQEMAGHDVQQSGGPFGDMCTFDGWPGVPLHAIAGRDDRFFPVELQQRVARERLGVEPDLVPGGHLAALSRPAELAAALARYL